jgi:hypothetical protein
MAAVMAEVTAIGKDRVNEQQRFKFRGVDDVMNALAGPFRKHGVFVLPEVREATTEVRQGQNRAMNAVRLRMAFHFHGPAGDVVTAVTEGEGVDVADKATNKAMAAAFKYALLYAFMIPTEGTLDEADADHHPGAPQPPAKPAEPSKALVRDWVDQIYKARDVDALKRVWTGIAASGMQDAETINNEGNPATLSVITTRRRQELEAFEKGEPSAGA